MKIIIYMIATLAIFSTMATADIATCKSVLECTEEADKFHKDGEKQSAHNSYKRACDRSIDEEKIKTCSKLGDYRDDLGYFREARVAYSNACLNGSEYGCKRAKKMKEKIKINRLNRRAKSI